VTDETERNKATIRRLYNEAITGGDLSAIDDIYAYDVELHLPGFPEDPYGTGPIRQLFGTIVSAFPGTRVTIEDLVAEDDRIAARVTFHRPRVAPPADPPSGLRRFAAWTRIDVFRLFQGKIVEQWADRDDASLLEQLGVQTNAS
jgi:predicted ester cyclase